MDIHEAETAIRVIQRQNQYSEQVCQKLQDALCRAALWKRAARGYRSNYLWGKKRLEKSRAENQRQAAEIERLREVLRALYGTYGVTKAWQRKWPNINTTVLNTLRETDHDPR